MRIPAFCNIFVIDVLGPGIVCWGERFSLFQNLVFGDKSFSEVTGLINNYGSLLSYHRLLSNAVGLTNGGYLFFGAQYGWSCDVCMGPLFLSYNSIGDRILNRQ